jgi:hypothetical protein
MKKFDGVALVIAWPQTYCKQAGAWYDLPMRWLGFNVDYYYQAGHAAIVLVHKETGECKYFDFGRYHSPFGYGRARSAETDPELKIESLAQIDPQSGFVLNANQIFNELQGNRSCHGDGTLYGSQIQVNYTKALSRARLVQEITFVKYGPFTLGGSNCSRFVSSVVQAGSPSIRNLIPLIVFVPLTPTTLTNVNAGNKKCCLPKFEQNGLKLKVLRPNFRNWSTDLTWLNKTYPAPTRHPNVPVDAQWLSGEGYGSWFSVSINGKGIYLTKYSPLGDVEFQTYFSPFDNKINFFEPFTITYPSNAKVLSILQKGYLCKYFN